VNVNSKIKSDYIAFSGGSCIFTIKKVSNSRAVKESKTSSGNIALRKSQNPDVKQVIEILFYGLEQLRA